MVDARTRKGIPINRVLIFFSSSFQASENDFKASNGCLHRLKDIDSVCKVNLS